MTSAITNRFDQAAKLILLADQYARDVNSSYDFDLERSANEILSLAEIDKDQLDDTQIRKRVEVLDDLIFDFIPSLITSATNSFSEMIRFGLIARDLDRNSSAAKKTLGLFENFGPEALKHGQAALDLIDSKKADHIHDSTNPNNGLKAMQRLVRKGVFSLHYPFPHIRDDDFDNGLRAFKKLRQAFTELSDFSDSKMHSYSLWLSNPHRSQSTDMKFLDVDFLHVFKKTTEGLAQVYDFVSNLKDQLPSDLRSKLLETFKKDHISGALSALQVNGAYVFRMVTDPNKIFPESPTSNDSVSRCPHSMSRPQ